MAELADALSSHARLVKLASEPGIGKTRLAQEVACHGQPPGARVLWSWSYEGEGEVPYWPWLQPIRSYVQDVDPERPASDVGPGAGDAVNTQSTERLGDRWMQPVLRAHNEIVRLQVVTYGGFEVKSLGYSFMLASSTARRALLGDIATQRTFAAHNIEHPEEQALVRMGLHTGEFLEEREDFFGKNVVLAERVADQALAGEIMVSSLLKKLTDSAGDI